MKDDSELERRVAALEREVAELRQRLAATPKPVNWLEAMMSRDRDEEAFAELAEIMRENREAGVFEEPGGAP